MGQYSISDNSEGSESAQMTQNITRLWIEAGKLLANDPACLVRCPVCDKEYLQVKDIRSAENPSIVEREIRCSSCGAYNYLRMARPLES
jgi:hypothetical protein